nr:hypothetical protein [uncultured Butyrivibrio sp.]
MLNSSLLSILATGVVETEAVKGTGQFDRLVYWIETSDLFKKYISTWAAPLNNASFDAVLLIVLFFILIWTVYGIIMNIIYHRKVKADQERIRRERDEYMKWLKESGAAGAPVMSFDEWRARKDSEGKQLTPEQKAVVENYNAVKDEVKDTAIGKLNNITRTLKERKEDRDLDKELDMREKEEAARKKAQEEEEKRLAALKEEPKQETQTIEQAMMPKPVVTQADAIRQKYSNEHAATELVDIPEEKQVSIAESSIVKEVEVPQRVSSEAPAEKVDVQKLLEEKTAETGSDNSGMQPGFANIIDNLKAKKAQEEKARAIENAAQEATEQNLKKLQAELEGAITADKTAVKTENSASKEDKELSAAMQAALRAREKERLKMERRHK